MYKVIIIDDEQLAIDVLTNYISRYTNFELVESFTNPIEAVAFLNSNSVDLVLSDINMPDILGTDIVRLIHNKTKFIMVTSHSEYAIESFELEVIDYLLKPVSFERFNRAIQRFEKDAKKDDNTNQRAAFFIKEGYEYNKIFIDEINYIEGLKDYVKIHCGDKLSLVLKTLKSLESQLEPYGFMRIHKSYIVPLKKIEQFNSRHLIINGNKIPVGASYRDKVIKYLEGQKL